MLVAQAEKFQNGLIEEIVEQNELLSHLLSNWQCKSKFLCPKLEHVFIEECAKDRTWTKNLGKKAHYPDIDAKFQTAANKEESSDSILNKIILFIQKQLDLANYETDLKWLIIDILFEIIEKKTPDDLKDFMNWMSMELFVGEKMRRIWSDWRKEMLQKAPLEMGKPKANMVMIQAAINGDYESILIFLQSDFVINDDDFKTCNVDKEDRQSKQAKRFFRQTSHHERQIKFPLVWNKYDTGGEGMNLNALKCFRATSQPAYMIAEFIYRMDSSPSSRSRIHDPISEAFHNAHIAQNLKNNVPNYTLHKSKFSDILRVSKDFTVAMLDHCKDLKEAQMLFSYDSQVNHYYRMHQIDVWSSCKSYPRLNMAVAYDHIDFVTHDFSQCIFTANWIKSDITGDVLQWDSTSKWDQALYILKTFLFTFIYIPFFFVGIIINPDYYNRKGVIPIEESTKLPTEKKSPLMKILHPLIYHYTFPINRCIGDCISHFCFLVWIILALENPIDDPKVVDVDWYDMFLVIWAFAYICEYLYSMGRYMYYALTKTNSTLNSTWNIGRRVMKFLKSFGSLWSFFDFSCYSFIFLGCLFKYLGYSKYCVEKGDALFSYKVVGKCKNDPTEYSDHDLVKTGYGLFGVGATLCVIKTFYWAQIFSLTGPLVISMKQVIREIIVILTIHIFLLIAFSVGLSYTLKFSNALCLNETFRDGTKITYNATTGQTNLPDWDIEEQQNKFKTLRSSFKTTFWSLFDPGHPEVVGCVQGSNRYMGMALWGTYQAVNVIILMNLLIALMNTTIHSILQKNKVSQWRFARTKVWIQYFDKNCSLPVPFNLLEYLFQIPLYVWNKVRTCKKQLQQEIMELATAKKDTGNVPLDKKKEEYFELVIKLIRRYLKALKEEGKKK